MFDFLPGNLSESIARYTRGKPPRLFVGFPEIGSVFVVLLADPGLDELLDRQNSPGIQTTQLVFYVSSDCRVEGLDTLCRKDFTL